jgi:hypothetical protein
LQVLLAEFTVSQALENIRTLDVVARSGGTDPCPFVINVRRTKLCDTSASIEGPRKCTQPT